MNNNVRAWMLPEGVNEALPKEAEQLNAMTHSALSIFARWGYQPLRPPLMEYAETFLSDDMSGELAEQTIQFKDQKSGRQLGLRADITPQIARIDAHYLKTDGVARYAYAGEVVRSYPNGHNNSRNPSVIGAELLGSASAQADVEIVGLLLEFLQSLSLPNITIELGNVDIIIELLRASGVDTSQFCHFFAALASKDTEKLYSLCQNNELTSDTAELLVTITKLYGEQDVLATAKQHCDQFPRVIEEIDELLNRVNTLQTQYPDTHFHIDLANVYGYGYHNGLIFSAYVEGVWQAIARGGRYDSFGNHFSERDNIRPSIGFSCELESLLSITPTLPEQHQTLVYSASVLGDDPALKSYIDGLRSNGTAVIALFDDDIPTNRSIDGTIVRSEKGFAVVPRVK